MIQFIKAMTLFVAFGTYAQTYTIHWKQPINQTTREGNIIKALYFEDASQLSADLKVGRYTIKLEGEVSSAAFSKIVYEKCTAAEDTLLEPTLFGNKIEPQITSATARNLVYSFISLVPIVKGKDGKLYKIKTFELNVVRNHAIASAGLRTTNTSSSSVLATGDWYKISVAKSGVYKLDYNYLRSLGVPVETFDPNSLQSYGFGGMLPEKNSDNKYYDIPEVPLQFVGDNDAAFEVSEYFLVYLQGPDKMVYNGVFDVKKNIYSDKAYYFITHSQAQGKRIQQKEQFGSFDLEYDYYDFIHKHEIEQTNYIHSGREWLGESLITEPVLNFNIAIPELVPNTDVTMEGRVQGSNAEVTSCKINFNGAEQNYTLINRQIGLDFNRIMVRSFYFDNTQSSDVVTGSYALGFKYTKASASNKTNLDYFQLSAKAKLALNANYLEFRNQDAIGNPFSKFVLKTVKSNVQVWDVSLLDQVSSLPLTASTDGFSFIDSTARYSEYVALDLQESFESPSIVGMLQNQDIHAIEVPDLLIVTYPGFKPSAEKLAQFRRSHDGYTVAVVAIDKIYNEFSSGAQDISAVRNFVKYLYDRDPQKLKWLLLFGACSYDYKDRISNNTNFIPIYETRTSDDLILSYQSDDYFGLLDPKEGGTLIGGMLDIGIGRLPVRTTDEAKEAVDKLIHYETSKLLYNKWKNNLTFVADDGDVNLHMNSTEQIITEVLKYNNAVKINKLYLPLFPEVATPTGQQSVVMNNKLKDEINNGTFLLNYSGHGREIGWAEENIITLDQIQGLTNYDRLFLMITATCEFGRYDDPNVFSSIQQASLNPKGGAIATIGATRPVFASSNLRVNTSMMKFLYEKNNGKHNTIGDVMRKSKNDGEAIIVDDNVKNYGLLGDPSLTLCYPEYEVTIDEIADELGNPKDTLKALAKVIIKGSVRNNTSLVNNFNGEVTLSMYDKELEKLSKYDASVDGNYSPDDIRRYIKVRESIIYQGKARVTNGVFSISVTVPKDISYIVGKGLMLTYAKNDSSDLDASGGFSEFYVGDSNDDALVDTDAPVVKLFVNDKNFKNGDLVGKNIVFLADIADESGINLSRSSVGHAITLTLDGNTQNSMILNEYYLTSGNFTQGTISYDLTQLAEGDHTISLKVWDVHNNSTTETISFKVKKDITIGIIDVIPDPFEDFSLFTFNHNRAGEDLLVSVEIFDVQGRRVRELYADVPNSSTTVSNLKWESKINQSTYNTTSGIYVYRVLLKSKYDGATTSKAEKLVFIK